METKSVVEVEMDELRGADGPARASQVELALAGTIRDLLRDHRALLERILAGGVAGVASAEGGTSAELIAQYRAIRRALALPDVQPSASDDARRPTSETVPAS